MFNRLKNMKFVYVLLIVALLASCGLPEAYKKLIKKDMEVPAYTTFEQIHTVKPVPSKFLLGTGSLLLMFFKRIFSSKTTLPYKVIDPEDYSYREKNIEKFFAKKSLINMRKLLSYARQLNVDHPYRINPFMPYATIRSENQILGNLGPAAAPANIVKQKNNFDHKVDFIDPEGKRQNFVLEIRPSRLPSTGIMFLFNAEGMNIDKLAAGKNSILEDIMVHEMTHIWHTELYTPKNKMRYTIESNASKNGHDSVIVTNPYLAFTEGLAEAFEAIYGSATAKILNLTPEERRNFFTNQKKEIAEKLSFLINRQSYIRRNSYLYNLYDFSNCTLRKIKGRDSSDIDTVLSVDGNSIAAMIEAISNGENYKNIFKFANFKDRFYSTQGYVSTTFLKKNCKINSPARLESNEGFNATLFYYIIRSGALVSPEERLTQEQEPDRMKRNIHGLLLGFRELVLAIKNSQAGTMFEFLAYLLQEDQLNHDEKKELARQILKASKGALTANLELKALFKDPVSVRDNKERIDELLDLMVSEDRVVEIINLMNLAAPIYVQYRSELRGNGKAKMARININTAHHIDLIDIFNGNNKVIAQMAKNLDQGIYFQSEEELLRVAERFNKRDELQKMLDKAKEAIKENEHLGLRLAVKELKSLVQE